MTIHYHGTPITPRSVLDTLAGRHFCVSFAAPQDAAQCHAIGQSVMLDNGAFSVWRRKVAPNWAGYYEWSERWLDFHTTWAVIPDVIDGGAEENDRLIAGWPHKFRGAPVWHMNESIDRFRRLCDEWPRVCVGSTEDLGEVGSRHWHNKMTESLNIICREGRAPSWLHMLRGMAMAGKHYPFASLDSTDVGRNHNRPQNTAVKMATLWDAQQCPATWQQRPTLAPLILPLIADHAGRVLP